MNAVLAVIVMGACIVAAATSVAALQSLRRPAGSIEFAAALPPLLRWLAPGARFVAELVPAEVPAGVRAALTHLLARAALIDTVSPRDWVALLGWTAIAGCTAGFVIRLWFGAPVWAASAVPLVTVWQVHGWLLQRARVRAVELQRDLPAAIDLLVLCLEAGASLATGIRTGYDKSTPGAVRDLFGSILRNIRSGQDRCAAFRSIRDRIDLPPVTGLLTALIQAESRGMSLGPALRAQAARCVSERFVRAEKAALQAPVRLLLPLLLFIFPCTFIVIAVPIAARLIGQEVQ